eukprot:6257560-Amphidinium_carterae.1
MSACPSCFRAAGAVLFSIMCFTDSIKGHTLRHHKSCHTTLAQVLITPKCGWRQRLPQPKTQTTGRVSHQSLATNDD